MAGVSGAPLFAHFVRVVSCPNGCPVVVLSDQNEQPQIEAHIRADCLEDFIRDLRQAAAEGAAMQRPPA